MLPGKLLQAREIESHLHGFDLVFDLNSVEHGQKQAHPLDLSWFGWPKLALAVDQNIGCLKEVAEDSCGGDCRRWHMGIVFIGWRKHVLENVVQIEKGWVRVDLELELVLVLEGKWGLGRGGKNWCRVQGVIHVLNQPTELVLVETMKFRREILWGFVGKRQKGWTFVRIKPATGMSQCELSGEGVKDRHCDRAFGAVNPVCICL